MRTLGDHAREGVTRTLKPVYNYKLSFIVAEALDPSLT